MTVYPFNKTHKLIFCLIVTAVFISLQSCDKSEKVDSISYQAHSLSEPKAVTIARELVQACGGLDNWHDTRFLTWRYLGKRLNVWDKQTGRYRSESRGSIVLMNLNDMQGKAELNGDELTGDALNRALKYGYDAWASDTYWIFLPFKLFDHGVILRHIGESAMEDNEMADILSVTFDSVGATPGNKYHIYVSRKSKLLVKWDYFENANDVNPGFSSPWKDYRSFGNILLSADRGLKKHSDIAVAKKMPDSVFESFEPVDWNRLTLN